MSEAPTFTTSLMVMADCSSVTVCHQGQDSFILDKSQSGLTNIKETAVTHTQPGHLFHSLVGRVSQSCNSMVRSI